MPSANNMSKYCSTPHIARIKYGHSACSKQPKVLQKKHIDTKQQVNQKQQVLHTQRANGFTLIELMIVAGIIGILALLGTPLYLSYIEKARSAVAIADISRISKSIDFYFVSNGSYPDSLADVYMDTLKDPWGNGYEYTNIANVKGKGKLRKDKNLVPINSDYDLYSKGPDGKSVGPLTAKASRDDIIRAGNGIFIGIAKDY